MPDSHHDPSQSAKSPLPPRRPDGEKPRAFADQSVEPIALPGTEESTGRPPGALPIRDKASLPSHRQSDRALPAFTPAPYQADSPADLSAPIRAELPQPRRADEHPKFRPPHPSTEHVEEPAGAAEATATPHPPAEPSPSPPPPAAPPPASRPVKHRLAANRRPELLRQSAVEADPESTDAWGGTIEDHDRRSGRRLLLWAALVSLPLAAFAIWQSIGRPGAPQAARPAPVAPATPESDAAEETRRAGEIAKRFLATTTLDERAALVRHPEITRPRMEAWYSDANPLKPNQVLSFDDRSAEQTIDGVTFIMLTVELDNRQPRSIALERLPDGGFLVDWESFVFWSDPKWPEFLSKEPAGSSDFRVVVKIENYFNYGYSDPEKWFCYMLKDPENWAHSWGYCPIDSEVGMTLNRMIRRQRQQGQDEIKAVLKLKFEESGKGRNQVLIEEVVQDGWIIPSP